MTDKLYRETINLFTIRQGYYYHLNAFDQVTNPPDDAPADLLFWAFGQEKVGDVYAY